MAICSVQQVETNSRLQPAEKGVDWEGLGELLVMLPIPRGSHLEQQI